ncbi:MAG: hypothetical protein RIE56_08155 [Amphiplicatus sp.]
MLAGGVALGGGVREGFAGGGADRPPDGWLGAARGGRRGEPPAGGR